MRILILSLGILLSQSTTAMERSITNVGFNPERDTLDFFKELDTRIMAQMKGAHTACQERNIQGFRQCLKNLVALLDKEAGHQYYLVDAYPVRGPIAQDKKRKKWFKASAKKSLIYTNQFRGQTQQLAFQFGPKEPDPTDEEWQLIGKIFNRKLPLLQTKKSKTCSNE